MNEISPDWEVEPLGRHVKAVQYGLSVRGQQAGRYPILRMNCQVDGQVSFRNLQFVDLDDKTFQAFRLNQNDILFNRTNSIELVGRTAIFKSDQDAVFASYLLRLTCDPSTICPDFLNFYLNKPETQTQLKTLASRGVSQANINATKLKDFTIPIPPKPEQEKIATVLWKVQRAIEVEDKLIATARELKQSALRQLFTRGLRSEPQKETEIGPVPEGWSVRRLADVANLERGRFMHRPRNEPRFYGGSTPFVQTGDVVRSSGWIRNYTQTLNDEGVAISRVFPKGTILITIAANIGFTGVLDFDSACPDSLIGITPMESVDIWYLEYFLQTQQPDMDRLAPKGTQKNINIQFLSPWPVVFPILSEQREIADILQTIDQKISVHERKRATLQELFKTLLHQLMTGQIRVHELDIDMSEVAAC
jgi:type I restriction enzyme, S subunit